MNYHILIFKTLVIPSRLKFTTICFWHREEQTFRMVSPFLQRTWKGPNGKQFDSYIKVNANSGQIQLFQESPDIRRNTLQHASQTDNTQRQKQKKEPSRLSDLNGIQTNKSSTTKRRKNMNETNYHIYKAKQISFVATNLIYLPQDESMQNTDK